MRFADSHVHLSDYADPEREAQLSARAGVELLAVSIDRVSSHKSLEIAEKHPQTVKAFVGVHPSEAAKERNLDWFEASLRKATGCGETGLDPRYSEVAPGSRQVEVFEMELQSAEKAAKPVQVHSRGAENACLQLLAQYSLRRVLLHWFEGEDLIREAKDRAYYVSLGPALLYSQKLQRIAGSFERSRILTESDGPVGFQALGGVKGPPLVPSVVFKLAELWKVGFEEAHALVLQNHDRYLGAGGKG